MRLALTQEVAVSQQTLLDIHQTVQFWKDRIDELGDMIGAPTDWLQQHHRAGINHSALVKIFQKEESKIFTHLISVLRLLRAGPLCYRTNTSLQLLEVGCGTGNCTAVLAALESKEKWIKVTGGDITPEALQYTKSKLQKLGYVAISNRLKQLIASSLTKKIKHPLLTNHAVFTKDTFPFHVVLKGRIGHRLPKDAWEASYREIIKLLPLNGAVIFYEPLGDMNKNLLDSTMREFKSTHDYRHLLETKLKLRLYAWVPFSVFNQVYVMGCYLKQ